MTSASCLFISFQCSSLWVVTTTHRLPYVSALRDLYTHIKAKNYTLLGIKNFWCKVEFYKAQFYKPRTPPLTLPCSESHHQLRCFALKILRCFNKYRHSESDRSRTFPCRAAEEKRGEKSYRQEYREISDKIYHGNDEIHRTFLHIRGIIAKDRKRGQA